MVPSYFARRRQLPHLRASDACYFVTWRLHRCQQPLGDEERGLVADVVCHFEGVRHVLGAWVIMDDHVHAIIKPLGPSTLDSVVHSWKSVSAKGLARKFGRVAPIWQGGTFDRILRQQGEPTAAHAYIVANPARRWPGLSTYPWVWPQPVGV